MLFGSMGVWESPVSQWCKWNGAKARGSGLPSLPLESCAYISLFRKCAVVQVINMQIQQRDYYVRMCCLPSNLNFTYRENTEGLQIHMKITIKHLQSSTTHHFFLFLKTLVLICHCILWSFFFSPGCWDRATQKRSYSAKNVSSFLSSASIILKDPPRDYWQLINFADFPSTWHVDSKM